MASLQTWVPGIEPGSDFSLANIPFGIVTTPSDSSPHAATAIGSHILDLKVLSEQPEFSSLFPSLKDYSHVFSHPSLNAFAALGRSVHREVRSTIQDLLSEATKHPAFLKDNTALREKALVPINKAKTHLPMEIGDYTDFYAGYHHAFGVGSMWRGPANALQPNYLHLPVGYHGRASSIVVSGTPIVRPTGQLITDPAAEGPKQPVVLPCRKLDIELELGCFVARGNEMGTAIDVDKAEEDHIFGYVLVNDWSARDIQNWEYVPLGPFNGKNFATTISPWVVTPDALEGFRAESIEVPERPEVQEYLREKRKDNVFDIKCEVDLTSKCANTRCIRPPPRSLLLTVVASPRGRHHYHLSCLYQEPHLVVPSDARSSHAGRLSDADGRHARVWHHQRHQVVRVRQSARDVTRRQEGGSLVRHGRSQIPERWRHHHPAGIVRRGRQQGRIWPVHWENLHRAWSIDPNKMRQESTSLNSRHCCKSTCHSILCLRRYRCRYEKHSQARTKVKVRRGASTFFASRIRVPPRTSTSVAAI